MPAPDQLRDSISVFDFEFLFLRSLLHSGACEGCFRGVYQNPPEGTGVTFAEIADVFATYLAVPYTAVCGTASISGNVDFTG